jgi:uncharacterized membrane protein YfcA
VPDLPLTHWILAVAAAFGVGLSKAGLPGVSLFHVVVFALLFGARESTGVVLPLLLVGDALAVSTNHQHARWDYIRRMLPPACLGVVIAAAFMHRISDTSFKPLIGWIILTLATLQVLRMIRPDALGNVPHSWAAVWSIGLLAGSTTMLANAAGPIIGIYCVAVALPKFEFIGTVAWFFFIVNAFKVPFSAALGLIRLDTLLLNALLVPAILLGVFGGRWVLRRVPQAVFDRLMLVFAAAAALRLIFG